MAGQNAGAVPPESCSREFRFGSRQHHGYGGAYQGCHDSFILGDVAVELRTYGRAHGGTLTLHFFNSAGHPCPPQDWARTHLPVVDDITIGSDATTRLDCGLSVRLHTYGKGHIARVHVCPVAKWRTRDYGRGKTTDVLAA